MINVNQIKKKISQEEEKKKEKIELAIQKREELMNGWMYFLRTFLGDEFDLRTDGYKSDVSSDIDIKIPGTDFHARLRFKKTSAIFLPSKYNTEDRNWILVSKNTIETLMTKNVTTFFEWKLR